LILTFSAIHTWPTSIINKSDILALLYRFSSENFDQENIYDAYPVDEISPNEIQATNCNSASPAIESNSELYVNIVPQKDTANLSMSARTVLMEGELKVGKSKRFVWLTIFVDLFTLFRLDSPTLNPSMKSNNSETDEKT
jgi:hypothetical protein